MCKLRTMYVQMKLDTVYELDRVDIKGVMSSIRDPHRYLESNMRDFVTEVGSHFMKNNGRNNHQGDMSNALNEAITGLRKDLR